MRLKLRTVLTTVFVAVMLVVGIDYVSFAATGGHALLGTINKANKTTTFKRTTAGAPVTLTTKTSTSPPLATNGRGKVANLNADLLDGKDSTAFAANTPTKVYKFTADSASTSHSFNIPIPANGQYLLTYSVPMSLSGSTTQAEWGYCEVGQSDSIIFGTYQGSGHASAASVPGPGPSAGPRMGVSASTVINPAGFPVNFSVFCNASSAWTTPPAFSLFGTSLAQPAIVTLTKLSSVSVTTGTGSRMTSGQRKAMVQRTMPR